MILGRNVHDIQQEMFQYLAGNVHDIWQETFIFSRKCLRYLEIWRDICRGMVWSNAIYIAQEFMYPRELNKGQASWKRGLGHLTCTYSYRFAYLFMHVVHTHTLSVFTARVLNWTSRLQTSVGSESTSSRRWSTTT